MARRKSKYILQTVRATFDSEPGMKATPVPKSELNRLVAALEEQTGATIDIKPVANVTMTATPALGAAALVAFDLLHVSPSVRHIDLLCSLIVRALDGNVRRRLRLIYLILRDARDARDSVELRRDLMPICEANGIGLTVLAPGGAFNLLESRTISCVTPTIVFAVAKSAASAVEISRRQDVFRPLLGEYFGHFEIDGHTATHVNAFVDVGGLRGIETFRETVLADVRARFGMRRFAVLAADATYPQVAALAVDVFENRAEVVTSVEHLPIGVRTVVFCGVATGTILLSALMAEVNARTQAAVIVIVVAEYADASLPDGTLSYVRLPYRAVAVDRCRLCAGQVRLVRVDDTTRALSELKEFDTATFWELCALDRSYYTVGHTVSGDTNNHYLFKINTVSLFRHHAAAAATRLFNALKRTPARPDLTDVVMIIADDRDAQLARRFKHLLSRSAKTVAVPRGLIQALTAGRHDAAHALTQLDKKDRAALANSNVIILDHVLNNSRTLHSLAQICLAASAKILGAGVFLARHQNLDLLAEQIGEVPIVALYHWPARPSTPRTCVCSGLEVRA
jgi:hypothetical protein